MSAGGGYGGLIVAARSLFLIATALVFMSTAVLACCPLPSISHTAATNVEMKITISGHTVLCIGGGHMCSPAGFVDRKIRLSGSISREPSSASQAKSFPKARYLCCLTYFYFFCLADTGYALWKNSRAKIHAHTCERSSSIGKSKSTHCYPDRAVWGVETTPKRCREEKAFFTKSVEHQNDRRVDKMTLYLLNA